MHPRYHYAPAANWLSDPNGLVHQGGEWHLFYQYNPLGEDWGHMAWGHAVSPDLAHWQELPPALVEDETWMIFSGSAVIDHADTAGFGRDAMVAIYTGASEQLARQVQSLASSTDNGRAWTKFAGNPVLDRSMKDFRDPNVFWHAGTGRWIMSVVLSTENRALIYGSADLKHWTELSEIPTSGAPGHLWECPLLIELPVEGTSKRRWLFKVDVLSGAPGSGALYLTGAFDGTRFVADGPWRVADGGSDFYAAIAWHDPRDEAGRPCWIGWMGNHAYQGKLPQQGWRGAMSLPRRMSLRRDGAGFALVQQVEPACVAAMGEGTPVTLGLKARDIPAASRIHIRGSEEPWVLELGSCCGRHLLISRERDVLRIQRQDPVTPELDIVREMALDHAQAIDLWVDTGSIEVLSLDGASAMTLQHRLSGEAYAMRADRELAAVVSGLAQPSA